MYLRSLRILSARDGPWFQKETRAVVVKEEECTGICTGSGIKVPIFTGSLVLPPSK